MRNRSRWDRRLYGSDPTYLTFEARRHRVDRLARKRALRLCDRCMHHRCYDTASERHSLSKSRSWKRHRRHQWRPVDQPIGEHSSTVNPSASET